MPEVTYIIPGVVSSGPAIEQSATAVTVQALAQPSSVTATVQSSGSVGAYLVANITYDYAVTSVDALGNETSAPVFVSAVEGATPYPVVIAWNDAPGSDTYNLYKDGKLLLGSLSVFTYTDNGTVATGTQAPPISNQTASVNIGGTLQSGRLVVPVGTDLWA